MRNDTSTTQVKPVHDCVSDCTINQKHLHDVTTLMAELKHLLVRHDRVLQEEGISPELQKLEAWLEQEREGLAPTNIISEGGVAWLCTLRDKMKLSAEETQRLDSEGGNPLTKDQMEKVEDLLKAIRRIDRIIENSDIRQPH